MGSRSKGGHGCGSGGGALRALMESAVQYAGPGGIMMTVWTPARELTREDYEELLRYLLERWGASFAGSIASGR